ncbi:hypothetical protein L484_002677 [Morus notabilis]|uniref:mTERF domain-containing protein 1 n=1 Tax=Morus notabilis TaxID=981085 RepID=W9RJ96_9ROSA|nr:uncharacterized protein LOC21386238 [Morus notabilis]EXB94316.1 hypothetical protein L484_002677 [Morus notabilis]
MSKNTDPHSFTVSYLQKSGGLSEKSAISASQKLLIETPEKADSVLELMRTHGLTQTHIANIIGNRPGLLLADLEGNLRPNMELLKSFGVSGNILGKMLSKESRFLERDLLGTVEFFRAQRFSDEQITSMLKKRPKLFTFNVNTNFRPKLEFFRSLGLTDEDVAKILSWEPSILERSLEKQIIPSVQVFRRVLGTGFDVLKAIKSFYFILEYDLENTLVPNVSTLKSHGVSETLILKMFMMQPRSLLLNPCRFSEVLAEVVKLEFDPNNLLFVLAVRVMATVSKTLWEQKLESFISFGLSRDEVYLAFRLHPLCMLVSEKKIKKLMNFFTHKLNIEPSIISRRPRILRYSLEKRIIPRSSMLQLLMSKGLIKEDFTMISLLSYLAMNEKNFMARWVRKYQNVLPDVVKAHRGEIEFRGLPVILGA